MTRVRTQRVTVAVTRAEREDHPNGNQSWRSKPNGTKSGMVELLVDLEALVGELGEKALRSKGKRSQLAGGLIQARVVGAVTRAPEVPHGGA